jgi:hypothetical protein
MYTLRPDKKLIDKTKEHTLILNNATQVCRARKYTL